MEFEKQPKVRVRLIVHSSMEGMHLPEHSIYVDTSLQEVPRSLNDGIWTSLRVYVSTSSAVSFSPVFVSLQYYCFFMR